MVLVVLDGCRMLAAFLSFFGVSAVCLICSPLLLLYRPLLAIGVAERHQPASYLASACSRFLLRVTGISVTITSDESGDVTGHAIYMYNHTSNLDPVIMNLVAGHARYVYKRSLGYIPVFGWLLRAWGHVGIDRARPDAAKAAINVAAVDKVNAGHCITMAPEGTRSTTGLLLPFKKGGFHLAAQTRAPIVPVVISGAHALFPPKSPLVRCGNVRVQILKPIVPKPGATVDELLEQTRAVFEAHPATAVPPPSILLHVPALIFVAVAVAAGVRFFRPTY